MRKDLAFKYIVFNCFNLKLNCLPGFLEFFPKHVSNTKEHSNSVSYTKSQIEIFRKSFFKIAF